MTKELFEQLISRDEGDTLDFKKEQYEFIDDDAIAKFVKDILAFANTIRKHNAYIIIGIEQTTSGKIFQLSAKSLQVKRRSSFMCNCHCFCACDGQKHQIDTNLASKVAETPVCN